MFKFLSLNLSVSPNILHFVRTFAIMSALGVRLIVIEKVQKYGEIVYMHQKHVSKWLVRDASPTYPWIRPCSH